MDNSYPHYQNDKINKNVETNTANYHGVTIEIKGNHPLANSTNYSLKIEPGQRGESELDQMSEIPNPSPRGKGKDHTKEPGSY